MAFILILVGILLLLSVYFGAVLGMAWLGMWAWNVLTPVTHWHTITYPQGLAAIVLLTVVFSAIRGLVSVVIKKEKD